MIREIAELEPTGTKPLGEGGLSRVFKYRHRHTGAYVAVKTVDS